MMLEQTKFYKSLNKDTQKFLQGVKVRQNGKLIPLVEAGNGIKSEVKTTATKWQLVLEESDSYEQINRAVLLKEELPKSFRATKIMLGLEMINQELCFHWSEKTYCSEARNYRWAAKQKREPSAIYLEKAHQQLIDVRVAVNHTFDDIIISGIAWNFKAIPKGKPHVIWDGIQTDYYPKSISNWLMRLIEQTNSWKRHFFIQNEKDMQFQSLPVIDQAYMMKDLKTYIISNYGEAFYQEELAVTQPSLHLQLLHLSDGYYKSFHNMLQLVYSHHRKKKRYPADSMVLLLGHYQEKFTVFTDLDQQYLFIMHYFYNFPLFPEAQTTADLYDAFSNLYPEVNLGDLMSYQEYVEDWQKIYFNS